MTAFADLMDEDRRLVILQALAEADQYSLNETLIRRVLERQRLGIVGRDILRGLLTWLAQHGLVRIEKLDDGGASNALWVAVATDLGVDVARGRAHPGVARPGPG